MRKRKCCAALAAAVIFLAAFAVFQAKKSGLLLPGWINWEKTQIVCEGQQAPDAVCLRAKRVRIQKDGKNLWQSDRNTPVQSVLWADIDRDGQEELLLLCWKRGRYGQSRPFWVEEDEKTWSQHIYIYDWEDDTVKPIWMASDIGLEAVQWSFDAQSRLTITDRTGRSTAWDWVSWGLSRVEPQQT